MSYVTFNTDLNLYSKKKTLLVSTQCNSTYLSLIAVGLLLVLLSECEKELIVLFITRINPNIGNIIAFSLKFSKFISRVISGTLPLYIFCISITPATCTLCYNISNMVPLVCKTRTTLVANYSYYFVKRY